MKSNKTVASSGKNTGVFCFDAKIHSDGTLVAIELSSRYSASDFHIREEDGKFVVDEFNSMVSDADAAHVESTQHNTLAEAIASVCERR